MTEEQAIKLFESKFWEHLSHRQRAEFQFSEPILCMPFEVFHDAMEKTLDRPVWTREFGLNVDGLKKELFDGASPPTLEDILQLIPEEKRVVLAVYPMTDG